jgi:hypothetical protein
VLPHKPPTVPSRNSATTKSQLRVDYAPLIGTTTGGSTITSLHLQWDQGSGGESWYTLIGEVLPSTSQSYTVTGYVVAGRTYKFRYRAKNIFGWGPYSDQGDILAASRPSKMQPLAVSLFGTNVKIQWTPSESNASPITKFKVLIMTSDPLVSLEQIDYCDGSSTAVINNNYCLIPMRTFIDEPYNLVQGDLIIATV